MGDEKPQVETVRVQQRWARTMMIVTGLVVLIAGMRAIDTLLVPFLLAVFAAVVCAPAMFWLMTRGVSKVLAVLLVVTGMVAFLALFTMLLGSSVEKFYGAMPGYLQKLQQEAEVLIAWLHGRGFDVSQQTLKELIDPGAAMRLAARMLTGLGGVLTNSFLIIITMVFILLEVSTFKLKLQQAFGDVQGALNQFDRFAEGVKRYMTIKALVSLGTGVVVALWLALLKVDFPLLWGMLAFMLNFVPNIGSIIAAVPAILVAYLQLGAGSALLAAAGYVVVNLVVGNVIEPRFMGRGLGLSTLVVFLSLVFWGWVLGPVGMVLSVPLTMTVKLGLESNEGARWLAILLGPGSEAEDTSRRQSA